MFVVGVQFKSSFVTTNKGGFDVDMVNTYCDYCDSNNCNGWTMRALPDEQFYDPDNATSLSLAFLLLITILFM